MYGRRLVGIIQGLIVGIIHIVGIVVVVVVGCNRYNSKHDMYNSRCLSRYST